MRTQSKRLQRPLTRIVRAASVVSCTAGIVVFINWMPSSIGGSGAINVPSGVAQGGAETALPANRPSRARCPDCGVIESAREVAKPNKASGTEQCADRVTAGSYDSAEKADLAILLDWHMNARNGYSFVRREIGCSTLAALATPLLIEPSKAFEILVRFRDGPSQILTEANLSAWRQRERIKEVNGSD